VSALEEDVNMQQLTGRVLTQETKRGVPEVLVTAIGTFSEGETRIGAVYTDDDGAFDFAPVLTKEIAGLQGISLIVSHPSADTKLVTTPTRKPPAAVETFLVYVSEKTLTSAGLAVPTGLPTALSEPTALIARATLVADRRQQLAKQLREVATERVAGAFKEQQDTESKIRDALLGSASSGQVVPDGQSIREAMLANVANGIQHGIQGAKQVAKLALTAQQLAALAPAGGPPPTPGATLDPAKVEAVLFGAEPNRDELVRTRLDLLHADCERRTRRPPISGEDPPPPPDEPTPAPLIELPDAVRRMVDAAARGIVIPGDRDTPGTLAEKLAALSVKGGAADEPAYFDFDVLAVAFDHLWKRQVDGHLLETAVEAYDELKRAGGAPPLAELPRRGRLFETMRARAQAVITAGIHVAETAALTGFAEVPDFDLLSNERRIRARDHRSGGDHRRRGGIGNWSPERPRQEDHRTGSGTGTPYQSPGQPPARPPARPATPVHTPAPPTPVRLKQLIEELDARMREPYSFEVFAADDDERNVNFGAMFTYRQQWAPQAYQAGPLVRTVTLAPREERAFTVRHTTKKTTTTTQSRLDEAQDRVETTDTARDVSDIVRAAKTSLAFQAEGSASLDIKLGSATGSWSVSRNAERSAQETRQSFREAVRKASQEHRTSRKIEISTTETVETLREETGKLVNPNDELPVTYLFFELQRRYRVAEQLHRLTPVILVAQEIPAPHEITRAWLLQNDWILHQALLDESFRPALIYLRDEAAGAEIRLVELKAHLDTQRAVVEELKDQILSLQNDVSQRYFALEQAMRRRIAVVREQDQEGWIEKAGEMFFGEDTSIEGSRAREEAAQEAWERAVRAEREARDRIAGAITALEAATRDYVEAEATFENAELGVLRLRVHVKQNILHYMQAIWDHEQRDQRVFRLHATPVPRLDGQIAYRLVENAGAPPVPPLWAPMYRVEAQLAVPSPTQTIPLGEIADLDRPLGYRGNYMIFPLKQHNVLTKFLSIPYADTRSALHDPVEVANFPLTELDRYVACLRDTLSAAELAAIAPQIQALYDAILGHAFATEDDLIVPSGSLFIEALPGTAPVLEDFKLLHRAVDVTKAAAEVRGRELENLRYAARILASQLGDPEIQTMVIAPKGTPIAMPAASGRGVTPEDGERT